jgi:hypothetical protein
MSIENEKKQYENGLKLNRDIALWNQEICGFLGQTH